MTSIPQNLSVFRTLRCRLKRLFKPRDASLKEALEEAIEEHEEQERLEPEEKVMLHNVLSFGDLTVGDIMVPRADIAAVAADISLEDLKSHITAERHTRIPVYEDTLDHVLGFIHVKDLFPMLSGDAPFAVRSVVRNALFVPPSMRIIDLLVKMRHAGSHMAIVVDEYGGTDGLVTMEDLFEEIVGDIHDEHDSEEEHEDRILRISDTMFEVSARIRVESLEKALGLRLASEEESAEFDTLGGLIFSQLGRVPGKGEIVPHVSGIRFEIYDADARRLRRVRVLMA
ncbi:MAG: HlyC/CorC family transporter [Pseudomonadota bacterium]|nr:HlyC/CorC family transporter [Pseudomonadota bacterium]MDE3038241.1 HlyC/CorC family transporter [Pseudomonadota bacterium]